MEPQSHTERLDDLPGTRTPALAYSALPDGRPVATPFTHPPGVAHAPWTAPQPADHRAPHSVSLGLGVNPLTWAGGAVATALISALLAYVATTTMSAVVRFIPQTYWARTHLEPPAFDHTLWAAAAAAAAFAAGIWFVLLLNVTVAVRRLFRLSTLLLTCVVAIVVSQTEPWQHSLPTVVLTIIVGAFLTTLTTLYATKVVTTHPERL